MNREITKKTIDALINEKVAIGWDRTRTPTQLELIEWFQKRKIYISAGPDHYGKFGYEIRVYSIKPYPGYYNGGSQYKWRSITQAIEAGFQYAIKYSL